MNLKKILNILLSTCMLSLSLALQAAKTPIENSHPPYADVWGYDLSEIPAMKWGESNVSAYKMDDGDIWFIISYSYKKLDSLNYFSRDTDCKYALIKFFKGEQNILSEKEIEQIYKITENKEIEFDYPSKKIYFKDGSSLETYYGLMPKKSYIPDFCRNYLIKKDFNGDQKKYTVLVATPQVTIHQDNSDAKDVAFLYQKLRSLTRIISLRDDTFIVFENGENLILRLDKNFKTRFKPMTSVYLSGNYIMRNFFIMDSSVIDHLISRFSNQSGRTYQNVHDALLELLHHQYGEKG